MLIGRLVDLPEKISELGDWLQWPVTTFHVPNISQVWPSSVLISMFLAFDKAIPFFPCAGFELVGSFQLHVSANNHAVMLYQNFGFKVEERILNFYDKYLPAHSTDCKHALFMRLTR